MTIITKNNKIFCRETEVGGKKYKVAVSGPVANTSYQSILSAIEQAGSVIPVNAVQALTIALSQGFKNSGFITVQRSFFSSRQEKASSFPGGLSLYSGISSSVAPSQGFGITIKVLKTHQVMYPGGALLDFIMTITNLNDSTRGGRSTSSRGHSTRGREGKAQSISRKGEPQLQTLQDEQIKLFNGILKGLKVETSHLDYKRKYTLTGMHQSSARETMINIKPKEEERNRKKEEKVSVAEYFEKTYNIELTYPDLPLVKSGKDTKLPIELCELVPNQPYFTSLDPAQQRDMIRKASQAPDKKLKDIQLAAEEIGKKTSGFTEPHFGFEIDPRAIGVNGRVLPSPKPGGVTVTKGAWKMSSVEEAGCISGDIKLGIVSMMQPHLYTKELHETFTQQISERAQSLGMGQLIGFRIPLEYCVK